MNDQSNRNSAEASNDTPRVEPTQSASNKGGRRISREVDPHDHEPIRDEVQSMARASGINEDFISELVDTFYSRIQTHETLGPIFNNAIGDEWDSHLPKMKRFWRSITLYTGEYSGRPVPVHQKLEGVEPEHFQQWLKLFNETLSDIAPNEEVARHFSGRAASIAQSLQLAMFGKAT